MLILAKALAIAVLVWFFTSAKERGEPAINWAITGFIGYVILWIAVYNINNALFGVIAKSSFIVMQIPALCAIGGAFFIRKKLISNATERKDS